MMIRQTRLALLLALQLICMNVSASAQAQGKADPPIVINSKVKQTWSGGSFTQLINMGQILSSQGNFVESEKCFKAALEMFASQPTESQNLTHKAYCLNNLALLYMNNGRLADAETNFNQVLQIAEKIDLTKDPILGIALDNLGQTYRFQKRFEEAEKTYMKALAAEEASIGKGTNDYAITQVNLAVLYITEKKDADAKKLLVEAMNTFETTAGKESASYQMANKYLQAAEKSDSN